MKKRNLGMKSLLVGMTLVFAGMLSGCGDKEGESTTAKKTETTTEAKTETTTEHNDPIDNPNGADNQADYAAYCGYWVDNANDVYFFIDNDFTWFVGGISTGDTSNWGTVIIASDHIQLVESSGEKVYTNLSFAASGSLQDDYGNQFAYSDVNPCGMQEGNNTVEAVIKDGVYYLKGDLSAQSYIYIKGAEFTMYYREAGEEPVVAEEGYYTPVDDASNYYAYSYADPNLYYTIHQADEYTFIWEGNNTYVWCE